LLQQNDSLALKQYEAVADNYGYDAGNLAQLNAAILLYKNGEYEAAAKRLENYDAKEAVIGAAAASLKGDCYVNLDKLDQATKAYNEAVKLSDKNPHYTPYFLLKLATVAHAQGKYADEADIYEQINSQYPIYGAENNLDIEKYLERAKALADAK
jgi:predicted negative regulator of RcsB-dependent stress response